MGNKHHGSVSTKQCRAQCMTAQVTDQVSTKAARERLNSSSSLSSADRSDT